MKKVFALLLLTLAASVFGEDKPAKETSSVTFQQVPNADGRYIQTVLLVVKGADPKRKFFVTWSESPNAKGYVIERSENDGEFVKWGEVAAGVTKFEEPKLGLFAGFSGSQREVRLEPEHNLWRD